MVGGMVEERDGVDDECDEVEVTRSTYRFPVSSDTHASPKYSSTHSITSPPYFKQHPYEVLLITT